MSSLELVTKYHIAKQIFNEYNVEKIINSPKQENYRNKINLSFGLFNGKKDVGSLQKNFSVIPAKLNNKASIISIKICEFMRDWVNSNSKLDIINNTDFSGFWRHITIHNNRLHHVMIIFHIQNLDKHQDTWILEFTDLKFKLSKFIESNNYFLNSIYYQNSNTKKETRNTDAYHLIYGEKSFIEVLDNYKFNISPGSFFQVNSDTAEIIYNKIKSLVDGDDKVILDLCCGTGTIGCFLDKNAKKVYSIDYSKKNCYDAEINRYMNNCMNQIIIHGKIEECVPKLIKTINITDNIILIINPPRKGLDKKIALFIKKLFHVKQIIYISCNIKTLDRDLNIMNLKSSIKNIIPINQFPNTNHLELIINIVR